MANNNRKFFIETRALFFRVCCYVAIDKLNHRKVLKTTDIYDYAAEPFFMRGVDVSRALHRCPDIKELDKQTAIKKLYHRSPKMLMIAYNDAFVNYYKQNRKRNPNPDLEIILSYDKRDN